MAIRFTLVRYVTYGIKEVEFSGLLQTFNWPVAAKFFVIYILKVRSRISVSECISTQMPEEISRKKNEKGATRMYMLEWKASAKKVE